MSDSAIRVLLVEDNAPDARLLAEALVDVGATEFALTNVERLDDAVNAVHRQPFDLVLLDLTLPDSSGLDTFRTVHRATPNTPIIVLTGLDDAELAVSAVKNGAQDYLMKSEASGNVLVRSMRYAIERHRLTADLKASETSFRIIATNADGLVVVDRDGLIQFANPATAAILGRSVESLVNSPFGYPLPANEITEFRVRRQDGLRDIEARVERLDWEGQPALLASLRDITDKRLLEEQLLHAQKMEVLGRLAGGVAHDFNNILTGITGHVELARFDVEGDSPLSESLEEIAASAERARKLVRQLLAFSRKEVVDTKILDLNAIIADADKMLRRLVGDKVRIETRCAPGLACVLADRSQLEQVIMNLAVNANDAMEEDGTLHISTKMVRLTEAARSHLPDLVPGVYVRLLVTDDGAGMDRKTAQRIFEPFYTTKGPGKGTGLGLSTVYGIVRRFSGYILVDSAVGKGTRFYVYFPPRDEPVSDSREFVALQVPVPGGDENVLVVDDDDSVRALLERVLREAGYQVTAAINGRDALERCGDVSQLDLLVSDLVMPEMDGPQLYEALLQRQPGLRAIFVSGYAEDVYAQHAQLLEGRPVVQKPFSLVEIKRLVRGVLDARAPAGPHIDPSFS